MRYGKLRKPARHFSPGRDSMSHAPMDTRRRVSMGAALLLGAGLATATDAPPATPAIAGVVRAGTPVELVAEGFEAVEGPLPEADGGLLFTNNRLGRVLHIEPHDDVSVWFE